MEKQKYTPGPWKIAGTAIESKYLRVVNHEYCIDDDDAEENLANARLIAAAPELLEACNMAFRTLEKSIPAIPASITKDLFITVAEFCKEAIAKATV